MYLAEIALTLACSLDYLFYFYFVDIVVFCACFPMFLLFGLDFLKFSSFIVSHFGTAGGLLCLLANFNLF